jgi:hypothetical protein
MLTKNHPKEIPTVTIDPRHFLQTLPDNLQRQISELGLTGDTKKVFIQAYYFGVVAALQEVFDPTYATIPKQIAPEWMKIAFDTRRALPTLTFHPTHTSHLQT